MSVFGLALCACASKPTAPVASSAPVPATAEERAALVKQEQEVGRVMAARLIGHFGAYRNDPKLIEYVNLVGQTVTREVGRPELQYRFGVLHNDEVNAYAVPGGYVFVTTGLLSQIRNESELAGVLSHEVAHVNERHLIEQLGLANPSMVLKREMASVQTVLRLMGQEKSAMAQSMEGIVDKAMDVLLKQGPGKQMEREADEAALLYTSAVGYDPAALSELLRRLAEKRESLKVLPDAPDFSERAGVLESFARENGTVKKAVEEDVVTRRFIRAFAELQLAEKRTGKK